MNRMNRRSAFLLGATAVGLVPPSVSAGSDPTGEAQGRLKFELYRGKAKTFHWRLRAANGRILATSGEGYNAKAGCRNAIELIREGASAAAVDDQAT